MTVIASSYGYGLDVPDQSHDYRGRNMDGAALIYLDGHRSRWTPSTNRRLLTGRSRYATEQMHALATIGPVPAGNAPRETARGGSRIAAMPRFRRFSG